MGPNPICPMSFYKKTIWTETHVAGEDGVKRQGESHLHVQERAWKGASLTASQGSNPTQTSFPLLGSRIVKK